MTRTFVCTVFVLASLARASPPAAGAPSPLSRIHLGNSRRGAALIQDLACVNCHSIKGQGGTSAPDLGRVTGRNYTPTAMASAMWNHAPVMWSAMQRQGIPAEPIKESEAADLFAYFYSIRFFDRLGDGARGKRFFFSEGRCGKCHGLSSPLAGGAPPVATWDSLNLPIEFAQQMWNHAPAMDAALASRNIKWTRLTSQELTDLLVYLQNLPETRGRPREWVLSATGGGIELFREKGCADCHQGKLSLTNLPPSRTLTDFAVSMWNHAPEMTAYARRSGKTLPKLEANEMREIVASLWYQQLYAEPGDAARGLRTFEKKNCSRCHAAGSADAPDLKQRLASRTEPVRPFSLVAVLWRHGPAMLKSMESKKIDWPRFSTREMADLVAYLNSIGPGGTAGNRGQIPISRF